MKFLSHDQPFRMLKEHLKDVSQRMNFFIHPYPFFEDKDLLMKIAKIIGLGHDFGKYTTYFQQYLKNREERDEANHGFISAFFTAYLLIQKDYLKNEKEKYFTLLAYSIVLHHHGNLQNIDSDCGFSNNTGKYRIHIFKKQLEDILKNRVQIEKEYGELGIELDLNHFCSQWELVVDELERLSYFYDRLDIKDREYFYSRMTFLYSCLIDADKREAAGVEFIERKNIAPDIIESFKRKKFTHSSPTRLNEIRNAVYTQVMEKVSKVPLDKHLFTLTSPTGSGKTITSFAAALCLRDKVSKEKKYLPRIIYSLPFTSIIDQTYECLSEILSEIKGYGENVENYLLKHHHLSDISYCTDNKEKPLDEALLLIESWESEVIVTTFIQLLYTVLGYKNSFLKKLHNITGSIIILDEVQNISVELWPLINKILHILAEELHCYVILLTATKPLIFNEDESMELLENHQDLFQLLDRTCLIYDPKEKTLAELCEEFKQRYTRDKSYLIVLNTITSSLKFYLMLKDMLEKYEISKDKLYYLSTNIYPLERKRRVEEIKRRVKSGEKLIVVSTQVIEAGVDIDMDVIYRDLGPIDSIVQVAGRGNREWSQHKTEVYVYNLRGEKRAFAPIVYGKIHCDRARKILTAKESIEEKDYYDIVYNFFNNVFESISTDESEKLLAALYKLCFYSKDLADSAASLADFKLIDEKYNYIDMFVITDESKPIWDQFIERVYGERDPIKRKQEFLKIKKDFRSFIISLPVKMAKPYIEKEAYLGVFKPSCDPEFYYDQEIGFKRDLDEIDDIDLRFL